MIKDKKKKRLYSNLNSGCVRLLEHVYANMKYAYTYSCMRTQLLIQIQKNYIFRDLIKQTYNM